MLRNLFALALFALLSSPAARAGDSTPPSIAHIPAHSIAGQPIHVQAHITDESRIFPQVFYRYGSTGPFEPPVDFKKVKGQKDEYEATIPYKPGPIDYYLECYDEFGNGPARAGSPESPLRVTFEEPPAMPLPAAAAEPAPASAPASGAASSSSAAGSSSAPAPAPRETRTAIVTTRLPPEPITAAGAAWRSTLVPGWGQFRDERKIRGVAFGVATGASLVATLWLTVRAHQANTIYVNAPITVRSQAYDQAVNYADARNAMLGITIGLWAVNIAEAWLLHGTKDPW